VGRVYRTGLSIRLAHTTVQQVRPFLSPAAGLPLERHGFHSAILAPLRVPGRTIGVLTTVRDRTADGYTAAEQAFLQELADYVAIAITTRQLAHRTRQIEDFAGRERLQREAIATISHDLRTPLAATQVAIGLLMSTALEQLDGSGAELLLTAQRNMQRLVILIEDLLAMNQLDAGVLELRQQPLDLRTAIAEAVRATRPLFTEKGQEVDVALATPLPTRGDARRLEQAVTNLLANAHRHTPPGTRVTLSGEVRDGEVRLAIRDNGWGIPRHQLETIFARHHRRDEGGGSGLGLAIARALIERHGGRLQAENAPEGGAIFSLALPAAG
jgi:K+-sensing histidine kinase KdpD